MVLSLDTPWVAALNGNCLVPMSTYTAPVEDDKFPSAKDKLGWSRSEVASLLDPLYAKKEKDVVWDSVVGVYRMRMLEDEPVGLWEDHLCAWLVRRDNSGRWTLIDPRWDGRIDTSRSAVT